MICLKFRSFNRDRYSYVVLTDTGIGHTKILDHATRFANFNEAKFVLGSMVEHQWCIKNYAPMDLEECGL